MKTYFDTGVFLKLYTPEPESEAVQRFVLRRRSPIRITSLHLSEATSALKLKCFRGEGSERESNAAIADIEADLHARVLVRLTCDWEEVWNLGRFLSEHHAARIGTGTLDVLHVACARLLGYREFMTTDSRQKACAKAAGLKAISP